MTDKAPLPDPFHGFYGAPMYSAVQMHDYAAAQSAADNAALRADAIRTQNEVVGPLRERVKVLEDALKEIERVMGPEVPECSGCVYEWNEALTTARAALEEK